ncbi:hypothetical protein ACHAP7_001273 [Fusarium lateritium]
MNRGETFAHAHSIPTFNATGHKYTKHITAEDLELAAILVASDESARHIPYGEYPIDWLQNARTLPALLKHWRKEAAKISAQLQKAPAAEQSPDNAPAGDASADIIPTLNAPADATSVGVVPASTHTSPPSIGQPKPGLTSGLTSLASRTPSCPGALPSSSPIAEQHPLLNTPTPVNGLDLERLSLDSPLAQRGWFNQTLKGPLHFDTADTQSLPQELPDSQSQTSQQHPVPGSHTPTSSSPFQSETSAQRTQTLSLPHKPDTPEVGRRSPTMSDTPQPVVLTQEQMAMIAAVVSQASATVAQQSQTQTADLLADAIERLRNDRPNGQSLRPADVGLFNPDRPDPHHMGMFSDSKSTTYTCVFAFTDRLRHLAETRSENVVKDVWTQCLQGQALIWHTQILTDYDRNYLSNGTVATIIARLVERFKPAYNDAMNRVKRAAFTLHDINKGNDIYAFTQGIIRDGKAVGFDTKGQLEAVYQAFDGSIKGLLKEPDDDTSVDAFVDSIRARESAMKTQARELYSGVYSRNIQQPWTPRYQGSTPQNPRDGFRPNVGQQPYQNQQNQQFRTGNFYPRGQPQNRWQRGQYGGRGQRGNGNRGGYSGYGYGRGYQNRWNGNGRWPSAQQNQTPNYQTPPAPRQNPNANPFNQALPQVPQPQRQGFQPQMPRQVMANMASAEETDYEDYQQNQEYETFQPENAHGWTNYDDNSPYDEWTTDDSYQLDDSYNPYALYDTPYEQTDNPEATPTSDWRTAPGYPTQDVADARHVALDIESTLPETCRTCGLHFHSRNALFTHLDEQHQLRRRRGAPDVNSMPEQTVLRMLQDSIPRSLNSQDATDPTTAMQYGGEDFLIDFSEERSQAPAEPHGSDPSTHNVEEFAPHRDSRNATDPHTHDASAFFVEEPPGNSAKAISELAAPPIGAPPPPNLQ